ncbi:MAG: ribosome-associated translation inhibitor RaiA [Clostridia bacterium]|nr:ribosome-associated translation inhibitor RaiA [Clostridia bacterium]
MTININGRKITVKDSFKTAIEKEMKKLVKFFDEDATANITITGHRDRLTLEATINNNGMIYRGEASAEKVDDAIKTVVNDIVRKIRKNKTKMEKRLREGSFEDIVAGLNADPVEEEGIEIVRTKRFSVKPMDPEEAVLQMEMIGNEFFMFRNVETDEIRVVYRRKDGNYGLIEPEN